MSGKNGGGTSRDAGSGSGRGADGGGSGDGGSGSGGSGGWGNRGCSNGGDSCGGSGGMLLHATTIEFNHPITGKPLSFTSEPPDYFPNVT